MTEMTHNQATALAAFVHELRPDWDKPGVLDQLAKARRKGTPGQVAIAAIRAATTGTNRTPAVIPLDGAHWRHDPATPTRNPLPPVLCRHCHQPHAGGLDDCNPDDLNVRTLTDERRGELRAQAWAALR